MKTRLPTPSEIDELVAFLPRLYAKGFKPIKRWSGGAKGKDGVLTLLWPEYDPLVKKFYGLAATEWWSDYNYHPDEAGCMLEVEDFVKTASLYQIKTMLTFCVRGERFCDGHWASMIESGHIRRLLERLAELQMENKQLTRKRLSPDSKRKK